MKLIYCPECQDVQKLQHFKRECWCGQSWGRYVDDLNAEIGGKAIPLGFANSTFAHALKYRCKTDVGSRFVAFVIEEECPTIRVEK